jgi:hypothetical protein
MENLELMTSKKPLSFGERFGGRSEKEFRQRKTNFRYKNIIHHLSFVYASFAIICFGIVGILFEQLCQTLPSFGV